jgi:hypothetical protein
MPPEEARRAVILARLKGMSYALQARIKHNPQH